MKTFNLVFTVAVVLCTLNAVSAAILDLGLAVANSECKSYCIRTHNNDQNYADSYIGAGLKCQCYSKLEQLRACRQTCIDKFNDSAYFASHFDSNNYCICKADQAGVDSCRNICVSKFNNDAYKASYVDTNGSCLCKDS